VDGVVLTCDLGPGLSEHDIPAVAAGQLRDFWRFTTGGPLLVDRQFGMCGLSLNDPARLRQQARDRYLLTSEPPLVSSRRAVPNLVVGASHETGVAKASGVAHPCGPSRRQTPISFPDLESFL